MKGPYQRLKYELRRLWECPACHNRCRRGGDVTSVLCGCQDSIPMLQRVWMKLVDDRIQRIDGNGGANHLPQQDGSA